MATVTLRGAGHPSHPIRILLARTDDDDVTLARARPSTSSSGADDMAQEADPQIDTLIVEIIDAP